MGFLQDLKFGLRMLSKNPGFTLVGIITLAIGIGANSTVFTLVNAVLLKGLPVKNPEEVVYVHSTNPTRGFGRPPMSYPDFIDLRDQSRSFKELGAYSVAPIDLSDGQAAAERVAGASIMANTFAILGSKPVRGRDFTPDDEKPNAAPVVLIRQGLWQTRYGGDPGLVGQDIRVNLKPYTVIGIMPETQRFPNDTKVWLPLIPDDSRLKRDQRNLSVFGRLGNAVSLKQAQTEVDSIARRLAQSYPATNKNIGGAAIFYTDVVTGGPIRTIFLALLGAVSFVLLIACANVANLLLSQAIGRTREVSIRTALGASRWRIARQLLIESIMLSFLGGLLGLGVAVFGVRMFWNAVKDTNPPYWLDFSMDYRVFAYFLAICVATGILFGLAPALQISRTNVNEYLKDGGRGSTGGVRSRRLTSGLLVGQIGLTIVLLVGAGLMIRSFLNIQSFNVGVRTENVLTAGLSVPVAKYSRAEDRLAFVERVLERVRAIPGIEAVTIASNVPAGGGVNVALKLEDRDINDGNDRAPLVSRLVVTPGYFQALRLSLPRGREFNAADGGSGAEAAIVNQPFVAKYWPAEDALGKRIRLGNDEKAPWFTVIGVSPPVYQQGDPNVASIGPGVVQPTVYIPYRQEPNAGLNILMRNRVPHDTVTAALRDELRSLDADLPLYNIRTLDEMKYQRSWPFRVFGTLFAIFAAIALVMSSVGIYAATAYGVSQRTQEIGIRITLGADKRDVLWLVLGQVLTRIAIGLTIGLLAAYGLSRVLSSVLYQVAPTDPLTFISISLLLSAVTIVACLLPARRATLLNTVEALRMG